MRIATFNINNVNRRLPNLLAWLREAEPDVVCLQELKATDAEFPADAIREAGYRAVWHGQKNWNGVAILARNAEPVLTRRGLPGDWSDTQSRYIEAAVEGVLIGCIYLPNGNPQPGPKFAYKLAWFDRLIAHAATLFAARLPVILAGDYNVVPTDADIYPSKSWTKDALLQPESRAAFRQLLEQGWTDAIRARHPVGPIYTFWDYKRDRWPRDAGLRLDHILLSPALAERLVDAGVDREVRGLAGASDHAPIWVVLDSPPRRNWAGDRAAERPAVPGCSHVPAAPSSIPRPRGGAVAAGIQFFERNLFRDLRIGALWGKVCGRGAASGNPLFQGFQYTPMSGVGRERTVRVRAGRTEERTLRRFSVSAAPDPSRPFEGFRVVPLSWTLAISRLAGVESNVIERRILG